MEDYGFEYVKLTGVQASTNSTETPPEADIVCADYSGNNPITYRIWFSWAAKIGFGEIVFAIKSDGTVHCDSENMGADFVKALLNHFVDGCEFAKVIGGE